MNPPIRFKGLLMGLSAALLGAAAPNLRADYPGAVLGLNPIAYYRLNETNAVPGDNLMNLGTAGLAGTGSIQNSPNQQVPGALAGSGDTAMDFAAANFSYVGVPYSAAINPSLQNPRAPFTVEAWLEPDAAYDAGSGALGCALSFAQFGSPREGWIIYQSETGWNLRMYNHNGTATAVNITGGGVLAVGTWYHVAAVYDGTNATLYVDGTNSATAPAAGFYPTTTTRILTMGLRSSFDFPWSGGVDEFALYPNALTAADILTHYQNGTNASPSSDYETLVLSQNPLLYYRMDDAPLVGTPPTATNSGSLGSAADATYDAGTVSGLPGVPYPGFGPNNHAVQFNGLTADIQIPPLAGVITDQFTFTGWFQYNGSPGGGGAPLMWQRSGADNASSAMGVMSWDGSQLFTMWNDQDYGALFSPPAIVPTGIWNFVTTVWTPTNTIIYINGAPCKINDPSHAARDFGIGPIRLGQDIYNGVTINGLLDEIALFDYALSPAQVQSLYGASQAPPQITGLSRTPADPLFEGQTINMAVTAIGPGLLGYQWRKGGAPLGGQTAATFSLPDVTSVANSGTYDVVVNNANGSVTSSVITLVIQSGPPVIVRQPLSASRFPGASVTFGIVEGGTVPISAQWYFNGNPIPGATNPSYTIPAVTAANAGTYNIHLTNALGGVQSSNVALTVVPLAGGYPSELMGLRPFAYWRFGETNGSTAFDYAGGHDGAISGGLSPAVAGPQSPAFPGLESNNVAFEFDGTNADVASAPLNLGTNEATFVALVDRIGTQTLAAVILNSRGNSGDVFQLGMQGDGLSLQYDWADSPLTYSFDPGFVSVDSQWGFVALVVSPTNTVMYLDDSSGAGLVSASNPFNAGILPFAANFNIGSDPVFGTSRTWNGGIDEVAVFNRALSDSEIGMLHYVLYNGQVTLTITRTGNNLQLGWSSGTLQSADNLSGPWTGVAGASAPSYTAPFTGTMKFYRVKVL